jgi:hypothetical protein
MLGEIEQQWQANSHHSAVMAESYNLDILSEDTLTFDL